MREPEFFKEVTKKELKQVEEVGHEVSQYVDDSTNCIGTATMNDMKTYTEQYLNLLEDFYTANKLQIDTDKTKIMVMGNKRKKEKIEIKLKNGDTFFK